MPAEAGTVTKREQGLYCFPLARYSPQFMGLYCS